MRPVLVRQTAMLASLGLLAGLVVTIVRYLFLKANVFCKHHSIKLCLLVIQVRVYTRNVWNGGHLSVCWGEGEYTHATSY